MDILTSIAMALGQGGSSSSSGAEPTLRLLILGAILGLIPAFLARSKGRSFLRWYIFGIIFWILPAILVIFLPKNQKGLDERMLKKGFRKCPACAELIKEEAVLCKHCNTDLLRFVRDASEGKTGAEVASA